MMLEDTGFRGIRIGSRVDTFRGASGEAKARIYDVFGYPFLAEKPAE